MNRIYLIFVVISVIGISGCWNGCTARSQKGGEVSKSTTNFSDNDVMTNSGSISSVERFVRGMNKGITVGGDYEDPRTGIFYSIWIRGKEDPKYFNQKWIHFNYVLPNDPELCIHDFQYGGIVWESYRVFPEENMISFYKADGRHILSIKFLSPSNFILLEGEIVRSYFDDGFDRGYYKELMETNIPEAQRESERQSLRNTIGCFASVGGPFSNEFIPDVAFTFY
ncbi:hypothetical protein [Thermospira aquatica]|uniref:Lipoprotein n=1 Tax=Thermospira aquatica TaxID=2828656 RepID=A0AAX3BEP1_9SPIR|nr:hypothetical protein [Thermospira aquatica]URA10600.1 hypothetical protein KDW03_02005 [Thermospira aquatica]